MKLLKKLAAICCTAALITACSSSDDPIEGGNPPGGGETGGNPPTPTLSEGMRYATLQGTVYDTQGNPISGVVVSSGDATTRTSTDGSFILSQVKSPNGRTLVNFSKYGYVSVVRAASFQSEDTWDVVLASTYEPTASNNYNLSSSAAQNLKAGNLSLELQADGYKNAVTGEAYTGDVNVEMFYLAPENNNFAELMPGGDLEAVRTDGSGTLLLSYGMLKVEMTSSSGSKLQLKEGKEATVKFPAPSGVSETLPASMPLWSFNEETGLWVEEGVATLQGSYYVGTVKHFSWLNLDNPATRATMKVKVVEADGTPVPGAGVTVGQLSRVTNKEGVLTTFVPSETAFGIVLDLAQFGGTGSKSQAVSPLTAGTEKEVTLTIPALPSLKGSLKAKGGQPIIASVSIRFTGDDGTEHYTKARGTKVDGTFAITGPMTYSGPARLHIITSSGATFEKNINLTGSDQDLGTFELDATPQRANNQLLLEDNGEIIIVNLPFDQGGVVHYSENEYEFMEDWHFTGDMPEGAQSHGEFFFSNNNGDNNIHVMTESCRIMGENVDIQFVKNGANYDVTFSGMVQYDGGDGNQREVVVLPVTITVKTLLETEQLFNVKPGTCGIPSFVPRLMNGSDEVASPLVIKCTSSYFTSAYKVCYYGAWADYEYLRDHLSNGTVTSSYERKDGISGYASYEYTLNTKGDYINLQMHPADGIATNLSIVYVQGWKGQYFPPYLY